MRVDWLLDDTIGIRGLHFLRDLMKVQDQTLLEADYVAIVIQFLYSRFREKIIKTKLPLYVFHLASVLLSIICNEYLRSHVDENQEV